MDFKNLGDTISNLSLIGGASLLAFAIAILITPWFHKQLIRFRIGKQIRDNAISGEKATLFAALHAKKSGTPTMGGLLIWGTIILVVGISWLASYLGYFEHSLWNRKETWIPVFTLVTCGLLGAIDDYINVREIGKNKGLSAKLKLFWLTVFGAIGGWWFYSKLGFDQIAIPIPGIEALYVGWWYIPIFIVIIVASANAVNFTDGLDGLAGGLLIMAFGAFGVIAYTMGMLILATLCGVICGALLAFLWFNIPPAKFYMGDTGSMALGATLGVIAMLTSQTLILPIIGFIFVLEAASVIIQLTSKKFLGRKVFKIAPIHHHFEQCGWPEFTVVMRFWIVGAIFTALGLVLGLVNLI